MSDPGKTLPILRALYDLGVPLDALTPAFLDPPAPHRFGTLEWLVTPASRRQCGLVAATHRHPDAADTIGVTRVLDEALRWSA